MCASTQSVSFGYRVAQRVSPAWISFQDKRMIYRCPVVEVSARPLRLKQEIGALGPQRVALQVQ